MPRSQTPLSLEFILLGFIHQSPLHGYDLYKKIQSIDGIALVWHVKQSLLYAMLDKLEENDLLSARIQPGRNNLQRKEYHLTDAGKEKFLAWLSQPVPHGRNLRQEFLAAIAWLDDRRAEISGEPL